MGAGGLVGTVPSGKAVGADRAGLQRHLTRGCPIPLELASGDGLTVTRTGQAGDSRVDDGSGRTGRGG